MAHISAIESEMEVHHRNAALKLCGTHCGSIISQKKNIFMTKYCKDTGIPEVYEWQMWLSSILTSQGFSIFD